MSERYFVFLIAFCLFLAIFRRGIRALLHALAAQARCELAYLRGMRAMRNRTLPNAKGKYLGSDKQNILRLVSAEGRMRWTPAMGEIPTRNSTEPCPACQAPCSECGGKGEHPCYAFGCGGRGYVIYASKPCDAEIPAGQKHPKDCACEGSRRIVTQKGTCTVCQGTKVEKCAVCRGEGYVSTGLNNGSPAAGFDNRAVAWLAGMPALWAWQAAAPPCRACRGTGWVQETLNALDKKNLNNAKKVQKSLAGRSG